MAKVDKIDAPLLVIGLGGTGADGVLRIKQAFKDRFNLDTAGDVELDRPPRTSYLVLDTDDETLGKSYFTTKLNEGDEYHSLKTNFSHLLNGTGRLLGVNLKAWETQWLEKRFYEDPEVRAKAASDGAGKYRQLARLAVFRQADTLVQKFTSLLNSLRSVNPGDPAGARTVKVVIVSGISGGTGSGTFLDVAYLLRHAANQSSTPLDIDLYIVMPDVTIQHHAVGDAAKTDIYSINGFAALKELDYWMDYDLRQPIKNGKEDFTVKYSSTLQDVHWNSKPFDSVTIMTATDASGSLLADAYNVVLSSVAETLTFMMATELKTTTADVMNLAGIADGSTADDTYSFQSARSNEFALAQHIPKPYPRRYGYRAVGTFSSGAQNAAKRILENQLVFQDAHQFMVDDSHQPVMAGREPDDFFKGFWESDAVLNLLTNYKAVTQYNQAGEDMFLDQGNWTANHVKGMDFNNTQIGHLLDDYKKNVAQQVGDLKDVWLKGAIARFNEVASAYLKEHGPQALQTILRHPEHGFLAQLEKIKEERKSNKDETVSKLANAFDLATTALEKFELPSLKNCFGVLSKKLKYSDYLAEAGEVYKLVQERGQFELTVYMAEKLYVHIKDNVLGAGLDYAQKALIRLKDAYEATAKTLKDTTLPAAAGGGTQTLGEQIRDQYEKDLNNIQLRKAVMECVCDTVLNTDIGASEEKVVSSLVEAAQKAVDHVFLDINMKTLDGLLQDRAGAAPGDVRKYVKETLAPTLSNGAQVHFALIDQYGKDGLTTNNSVVQGYISIPKGLPDVLSGIKDFVRGSTGYTGTVFKNSAIEDQVFWQQIASCIPLCAYAPLSRYEKVYNEGRHEGKHLSDCRQNPRREPRTGW